MRLDKYSIGFYAFVAAALIILLLGLGHVPLPFERDGTSPSPLQTTVNPRDNVIVRENALQGTTGWEIPAGQAAGIEIQAYSSATSVLPGQPLIFYVSTQGEGTPYSIGIYRLGWYGGLGGRLMFYQAKLVGQAQGYYDNSLRHLVGCSSCRLDLNTGLVEANWQRSYTLTVPSDWTTGIYLAKFTDANDMQTYAPFDVRGNSNSAYVAVTPDATYAAYNKWGGYSLYVAPPHNGIADPGEAEQPGEAVKVSFDRPYVDAAGSSNVLSEEANAIHWLERQGYDLSYMSDVDLHKYPAELLHHRAYLSLGHDEYWSKVMRYAVWDARASGVGLAFLGANDVYWQIRLEPDSAGTPDRTVVCYKVGTDQNDLARDPLYGKDNSLVTAQWRDPVLDRPESLLIGIMYSHLTQKRPYFPWRLNPQAKSPLLVGTGLQPGKPYGCSIVGNEWDRVFNNDIEPAGLQVLGSSYTIDDYNQYDVSNTTYYIAPSGAMVFAAGSINWTLALDSYRFYTDQACATQNLVVPGIQKLLAHVMDALIIHHPSQQLTDSNFLRALG